MGGHKQEPLLAPMARSICCVIALICLYRPTPLAAADLDRMQNMRFERLTTLDGLAQNTISAILQDDLGFIWLGTRDGLSRYDGYNFKTWRKEDGPNSLHDNDISALMLDINGCIWVGTMTGGMACFDPEKETFEVYEPGTADEPNALFNTPIYKIDQHPNGDIWVATENGLCRFDPPTQTFTRYTHNPNDPQSLPNAGIQTLLASETGIWVGTANGIGRLDPDANRFEKFTPDAKNPGALPINNVSSLVDAGSNELWLGSQGRLSKLNLNTGRFTTFEMDYLNDSFIYDMIQDRDGLLWIATFEGLLIYDPKSKRTVRNQYRANDIRSLSQNYTMSLFEDRSGVVWIGTFGGGLSVYNRFSEIIQHFRIDPDQPAGFSINTIMGFAEALDGGVLLASYMGGLVHFNPKTQLFTAYKHDPDNPESIPGNRVNSLARTEKGKLWVASSNGVSVFDEEAKTFSSWLNTEESPTFAQMVIPVDQNQVWVATYFKGLIRLDPQTRQFISFEHDPANPNSIIDSDVLCILYDHKQRLWIGTSDNGLDRLDGGKDFHHYRFSLKDPKQVPHPTVLSMHQDRDNRIWLGTMGGGLSLYHEETDSFTSYNTSHGLANDKVFAMVSDARGFLWVCTNRGLSRFEPRTRSFKNYDTTHNLQGDEFGRGAAYANKGNIYLGGINGFNIFNSKEISEDLFKPTVTFTSFKKYNREARLPKAIAYNPELILNHDEVFISFQCSALDFKAPGKNIYAYQMEGLDSSWYALGNRRDISFSNLDPGFYRLNLKATNHEGIWNETPTSLNITVLPPWWQTWQAYLIYSLAVIGSIFALILYWRNKLAREQAVNQQLREFDRLKDEFLANTSHELKTPLHGLVGIAESLLEGAAGDINDVMADNLSLMVIGGRRLEHLVNDILDFSKMKHHDLELQLKPVDLKSLVQVVCTLCKPMSDDKSLELINAVPDNLSPVLADEDRLQQIFYNLIGNAIKFTSQGSIRIGAEADDSMMTIKVSDTGIGFDPEHAERLFESFEQADGSTAREYGGTGLGLAITRGIVQKHGGSITADATPCKGSIFSFTIPLCDTAAAPTEIKTKPKTTPKLRTQALNPQAAASAIAKTPSDARFHILAVDDEPANRQVLANFLGLYHYQVTLAANGEEAMAHVAETKFDLILLDVMMPRLSGYEVCAKLREKYSLHELPVLFLTAKSQIEDMVTGFNLGANDYITKPFSKDELLSRVRIHLDLVDINRNLEHKVAERTTTLRAYTEELEVLDHIVRNINREVEPQGLFDTILDQCMLLFPRASAGTFLYWDEDQLQYRFVAVKGYQAPGFVGLKLTHEDALSRYTRHTKEIGTHIFVDTNFGSSQLPNLSPKHPKPKSLLAISVRLDQRDHAAFLLLDYKDDPDFLHETEIIRLQRFREHVVTALNRARMLTKLERHQRDLVEAAHLVGMAENATMVLHHMGNGLNSVNISVQVLQDLLRSERWAPLFEKILNMLSNQESLEAFLLRDPKGENLVKALQGISNKLQNREHVIEQEVKRAEIFVQDLLRVLRDQREYTRLKGAPEALDLNYLIKSCIDTGIRSEQPIEIIQHYGEIPRITAPKIKVIRMITFLLQKADRAIRANESIDGKIMINTSLDEAFAIVEIIDNGVGIPTEELSNIFSPATHTEGNYMGFGLHNCANDIKEMGGVIQLVSNGTDQGTKVTLRFPIMP